MMIAKGTQTWIELTWHEAPLGSKCGRYLHENMKVFERELNAICVNVSVGIEYEGSTVYIARVNWCSVQKIWHANHVLFIIIMCSALFSPNAHAAILMILITLLKSMTLRWWRTLTCLVSDPSATLPAYYATQRFFLSQSYGTSIFYIYLVPT